MQLAHDMKIIQLQCASTSGWHRESCTVTFCFPCMHGFVSACDQIIQCQSRNQLNPKLNQLRHSQLISQLVIYPINAAIHCQLSFIACSIEKYKGTTCGKVKPSVAIMVCHTWSGGPSMATKSPQMVWGDHLRCDRPKSSQPHQEATVFLIMVRLV